ncbi:laminin-like protein epi-1 [Liolophura sinensis]|uniref:laminin-like protein epi-1 n=1 Tax=Liolophura sinensis TaxID=3198878 RepID=UPI003157F537
MHESVRPGRLQILKSLDGATYTPWLHKVTLMSDCESELQVPSQSRPTELNPTICNLYKSSSGSILNEIVEFDIVLESYKFRQARYLKINFYEMELILGVSGNTFQHYTVQELTVMAACSCYGHDIDCKQSNVTGQYECVCGENTQGEYCNLCKPLYNQQDFARDIPCEQCNCFGHATECIYLADVDRNNQSLNTQGVYSGGGVCLQCSNNTYGVNCQSCEVNYYRPMGRQQTAEDACVRCDCDESGVGKSPLGAPGDCVMNSESPEVPDMAPGDCYCKGNVQGRRCDECRPGFYDLRKDDPWGCKDCLCETSGTVGNTAVCNSNSTGQCPCKQYVTGRQCNICQDGFYNLTSGNVNGCDTCSCDPGGVIDGGCHKDSGQCTCKSHITGRQCDSVEDGFYYPELHYIFSEVETPQGTWGHDDVANPGYIGFGYAILKTDGTETITLDIPSNIPSSQQFSLVFRYKSTAALTGTVTLARNSEPLDSSPVTFTPCIQWCYVQVGGDKLFGMTPAARYDVTIIVSGPLLLDRLVAIPQEFLTATVLGPDGATFKTDCRVLENGVDSIACQEKIFSVVMGSFPSALPCGCDLVGSNSSSCEKAGGQCSCRPGVDGRTCDKCRPDHHSKTFTGCQPCNCAGANKLCDSIGGQCYCSPNTMGLQCDQCEPNHYSWTEADGCLPCNCDEGSANLQCNATTGVCDCDPGVIGEKCDQCEDTFKSLSASGCASCGCNLDGSMNSVCNKTSGQCPCKDNVDGMICNQCKDGSFDLAPFHPKGCADCVCMGVTTACESSQGYLRQVMLRIADEMSSNLTTLFTLVTATGVESGIQVTGERRPIDLFLTANIDGTQPLFWRIDSDGMVGNVLGLYGSNIKFDLSYNGLAPGNLQPLQVQMVYNNGQILTKTVDTIPDLDVPNTVLLRVTEDGWTDASGQIISRQNFLLYLTAIQAWHLPARILDSPHETSLSKVYYSIIDSSVVGPQAIHVEQCQCGPGYQGYSCERCAAGYKRVNVTNHPYLGFCEPCSCNGHSNECNPDTGECLNCRDNTEGVSCERCIPGYYGDAAEGASCVQCPCYEPRVSDPGCDVNNGTVTCRNCKAGYTGPLCDSVHVMCQALVVMSTMGQSPVETVKLVTQALSVTGPGCDFNNGTVTCQSCNAGYTGPVCDSCEPFHFGQPEILFSGTCTPCDCNGNTDECDPVTGECVNCGFNTTGNNCERCQDGYYGNASQQICQPCGCVETGRLSPICNPMDGKCDCMPGVGGRTCNACMEGFWGYENNTFEGCQDCMCNQQGSVIIQCNDITAKCICKQNVSPLSDKCDLCNEGFWGLPEKACSPCDCDRDGTIDPNAPCNGRTGQCDCKEGIEGRQCNVCKRLYSGAVQTGCTKCGICQESLGNDTLALQDSWKSYWMTALNVGLIQDQDLILQNITSDLDMAKADIGIGDLTLANLQGLVTTLTNQQTSHSADVANLHSRLGSEVVRSETLKNDTVGEKDRINSLVKESNAVAGLGGSALSAVRSNITTLEAHKVAAESVLTEGRKGFEESTPVTTMSVRCLYCQSTSAIKMIKFQLLQNTSIQTVNGNLTFSTDRALVDAELALIQNVSDQVNTIKEQVDTQNVEAINLEERRGRLQGEVEVVQSRIVAVDTNVGSLITVKQSTDALLQTTQVQIDNINGLVNATEATLASAREQLDTSSATYQTALSDIEDCNLVLGQNPSNLPLPLNTTADISGIQSWPLGYNIISSALNQTRLDIQSVDGDAWETLAATLQSQAQSIQSEYQTVEPLGREAVAAKANYENSVESLSSSLRRAQEASQTVTEQSNAITGINLENLQNSAISEKNQSDVLLGQVNSKNYQPSVLESHLRSANASLQTSVSEWNTLKGRLDVVMAQAEAIDPVTRGNTIRETRVQAESKAAIVQSAALLTITNDQGLSNTLDTLSAESVGVQNQSNSAINVVDSVASKLQAFNDRLLTVERLIEQANSLADGNTDDKKNLIDERMTNLTARILYARQLAQGLRQPVAFTGNKPVIAPNPISTRDEICNHVSFEFKAPKGSSGLLLFAEDPATPAEFVLELVNENVVFHFAVNYERVQMTNPAQIRENQWAKVEALRCGNSGQLSVTVLSTGATAMTYRAGISLNVPNLRLTSQLYMGGLPTGYETTKTAQTSFIGCMYNVMFQNEHIPLWDLSVQDGEAGCCSKPEYFDPIPSAPGTSLSGFGHLQVHAPGLNFGAPLSISVKFRTFTAKGVLFIIERPGTSIYYAVLLKDGKVVFEAHTGNTYSVSSTNTYNDGKWYMVTTSLSSTEQEMILDYSENGAFFHRETSSGPVDGINLLQLQNQSITFGSVHPTQSSALPSVNAKLPGDLRDLTYGPQGGDLTLQPFSASVISQSEVYNDVPLQRDSGLQLLSENSYAMLTLPTQATITSISVYFSTYDTNGVLIYAASRISSDVLVYIALWHANIVVYVNEISGANLKGPFHTLGQFVSDGLLHSVTVEITDTFTVRLIVDDVMIEESSERLLYPSVALSDGRLFIGRVPDNVQMDARLPVRSSLIGGISSMLYNTGNVILVNPNQYTGHQEVSLAGIPKPRVTPIPPPYDIPEGEPVSCLSPAPRGQYSDEGVRFGDTMVSFQKHQLMPDQISELSGDLGSFVLSLQFRSFASDGILFYVADRLVDPVYWFAVYLNDGYVTVSMSTSTNNPATARLTSVLPQYSNGQWWEVDILRINDFLAIVVTDDQDYKNNNENSSVNSVLPFTTPVYIGGLDSKVSGQILPAIEIGKVPLIGCVRRVEITPPADRMPPFLLDLQNPQETGGTSKCFSNAVSGVRMSGHSSHLYITTGSSYSFMVPFKFSVTIRTVVQSANLFTIYQSADRFVVLDIDQGQIRLVMGNSLDMQLPFILSDQQTSNPYTLCNNEPHTISVEITSEDARLKVDNTKIQVAKFQTGFTPVTITGFFSVGGVPSEHTNVEFPVRTSKTSFAGCLDRLTINGQFTDPQFIEQKSGISYGCFVQMPDA